MQHAEGMLPGPDPPAVCHIVVRMSCHTLSMDARFRTAAVLRGKTVRPGMGDGVEMSKASKVRLMLTDFAASLAMAISIGLATSITLAGAVLLIAQHSAPDSQSGTSRPAQGAS
jgi:hypothetical protein